MTRYQIRFRFEREPYPLVDSGGGAEAAPPLNALMVGKAVKMPSRVLLHGENVRRCPNGCPSNGNKHNTVSCRFSRPVCVYFKCSFRHSSLINVIHRSGESTVKMLSQQMFKKSQHR